MIYDEFKKYGSFKKYEGTFGVEIETESKKPYPDPVMAFWNCITDGSLRDHGREYVLKVPLKYGEELNSSFKEFETKTTGIKFEQESNSTSVHVHINMLSESFLTMGNFITTYAFLENILMEFSGESRKGNLFCLPICDAEQIYKDVIHMFKRFELYDYGWPFSIDENSHKYAALNLASLGRLGSLEVRSFRGTTDIALIKTWIGILNHLLDFSRRNHTPHDIILMWKKDPTEFLKEAFGPYYSFVTIKNELAEARRNFWYAASIAYSVNNWKKLDRNQDNKNDLTLEEFCKKHYGKSFVELDQATKMLAYKHHHAGTTPNKSKKAVINDGPPAAWINPFIAAVDAQAGQPAQPIFDDVEDGVNVWIDDDEEVNL